MEQTYSKRLEYEHIKDSAREAIKYIDERRTGKTYSLRTRWRKFNNQMCGGFEPNTLTTIVGISGSGKSSFINQIETDLIELNPWANVAILSLNWEMLSSRQVGRKLSHCMDMTTSQLYSGRNTEKITDEQYKQAIEHAKKIAEYPIYYVNIPGNVEELRSTIFHFMKNEGKGKWVVIILDHTLLVRGKDLEVKILPDLQKLFMEVKKYGRNTIIQLSQMNRNIETPERINNFRMHFPTRSDLYGSDQVFHSSDIVIALHRPELLGLTAYGKDALPVENLIYLHILKQREGEPGIIPFKNILKYNKMEEIDNLSELKRSNSEEEADLFNN